MSETRWSTPAGEFRLIKQKYVQGVWAQVYVPLTAEDYFRALSSPMTSEEVRYDVCEHAGRWCTLHQLTEEQT